MKTFVLLAAIFTFTATNAGCDILAPQISKAQSERAQLATDEKSLEQLTRIADACEAMVLRQGVTCGTN